MLFHIARCSEALINHFQIQMFIECIFSNGCNISDLHIHYTIYFYLMKQKISKQKSVNGQLIEFEINYCIDYIIMNSIYNLFIVNYFIIFLSLICTNVKNRFNSKVMDNLIAFGLLFWCVNEAHEISPQSWIESRRLHIQLLGILKKLTRILFEFNVQFIGFCLFPYLVGNSVVA